MPRTARQTRKVCILLNRNAGTARGGDPDALGRGIAAPFAERGDSVDVRVRRPQELGAETERLARKREFDLVVICGGDGTLSRCADALAGIDVALGFVPLGTMNLFARALGMPADAAAAAEAIANGAARTIDIVQVNGRHFLHHVSFGLHPKLIRQRQRLAHGSRVGKIVAGMRAFAMSIRRPPRLHLAVEHDGATRPCATPSLVVTNNPLGPGHLPFQDDVTSGCLGVYICHGRKWAALARLGADVLLGRIGDNPDIEAFTARSIRLVRIGRRKVLRASIDGELAWLPLPVTIETVPAGLCVMMPAEDAAASN